MRYPIHPKKNLKNHFTTTQKFGLTGINMKGVRSLLSFFILRTQDESDSPTELIDQIKNGNPGLKNEFINKYRPFIIKAVSKALGNRFIDVENSEEYSIGLMAFDEAIGRYDKSRKQNFFDFAKKVIKCRIINYWANNQKNLPEYPFTYFQKEADDGPEFLDKVSDQSPNYTSNYETKEEIILFNRKLAEFGITLKDLLRTAPKHQDSKLLAVRIARIISNHEDLYQHLISRRSLPTSGVLKFIHVNPRTLERNRKFIIAVCLILRSELEIIKSYVDQFVEDGDLP
jgi:RNA polymerase sigma factor